MKAAGMPEFVPGSSAWTDELTEGVLWQQILASDIKSRFVSQHLAAARAEQARSMVPELVTLTQAALESGWGKHAPRFNFFGIKAKASAPPETRQLLRTKEVLPHPNYTNFPEIISITKRPDGKYLYVIRDWFRAFPDAAAAFKAHGDFLVDNPRYDPAFAFSAQPFEFAQKVADAGYATDPEYAEKLKATMRGIAALIA